MPRPEASPQALDALKAQETNHNRLAYFLVLFVLAATPSLAFEPGQPDQRPANIYDSRGNYKGQVKPEGPAGNANVYDSRGSYVGNVDKNGNLRDKKGLYLGQVRRP